MQVTISASITESLKKSEIVPDVLDDFAASTLISISYAPDVEAVLGNTLEVAATQHYPKITLALDGAAEPDTKYTIVMTDPDAPTRGDKKWSEYCHFVVSNLSFPPSASSPSGSEHVISQSDGTTLMEYFPPGPPPKTGKHRYVWIVYKQNNPSTPSAPKDRPCWGTGIPGYGVRDWAKENNLTPTGVNFFYAQNVEQ
ncbi:hypothetical protein CANCADRAFT_42152 [Tortispora caseinolytica NRRL Y-17796]|uniref:Phosphatidylethanolamine-binding protein n=1 Tax=Tortispora caseinolytica NRRL Y-17796 TaxID=767744 RepID=A0A1E4TIC5_9ASCO|nr:hypothetical protein CANCADRAFT_42152 [Tortispora caseinolytica NRRL Y-17796]